MVKTIRLTGVSVDEFQSHLGSLWAETRSSDAFRKHLLDQGIDLQALDDLASEEPFRVSRVNQGFDGSSTAVAIAFAPVAAKIVGDLWDVFFPILRHKLGKGSLAETSD